MSRIFQRGRFPDRLITHDLAPWEYAHYGKTHQHSVLARPFRFRSELVGWLVIPKGFVTDQGSVPAVGWWVVPGNGADLGLPSIPHDWLYFLQGKIPGGATVSRKVADLVLAEAMRAVGAPEWRVRLVYLAVRLFGAGRWHA